MNTDLWNGRKVLITGSNGYLGVELCSTLSMAGSNVVAVDVSKEIHSLLKESKNIQYNCLDLANTEGVKEILEKHRFETCFHLAANSDVSEMNRRPDIAFRANVEAAWNLFEIFRNYLNSCHIIFTSSNHVYGKQPLYPTSENSFFHSENIYGVTKGAADLIALGYARIYEMPITVARITNTFGGKFFNLKHLIPQTIKTLSGGEIPVIKGDGQSRKGFLYIEDTLNAIMLLAEKMQDKNIWGEAFNFFPDKNTSVLEIVQSIISVLGKVSVKPVIQEKKRPQNKVDIEYLCNRKSKEILGWEIKNSFPEGVKKALDDYENMKLKQ